MIGFSLGAAVTLIEASENRDIHSIIAVSSPSDFWKIDYRFWKREMFSDLKLNIGPKGRGKSVRPGNPFRDKIAPIEIVDKVAPTPILFLHGEKDWLIKPQHSRVLFEKALQPKKLYIIHNVGHAEKIYDDVPDSFKAVCLEWFAETLA